MSMSNFSNKGFALITGASSGIGAVYGDRLAKRGYDLILVARTEARMKSLWRLTSETGRSVKVLPTDLNNGAELAKVEAMLRNDPSITMLVNNAGTASVAPLLDADSRPSGWRRMDPFRGRAPRHLATVRQFPAGAPLRDSCTRSAAGVMPRALHASAAN
jgi:NADP-dependent 3-hydroxy acid dehydrogenase YdfG